MLYDLMLNMIDKYGYDTDLYKGTGGNNKTLEMVMLGLKLQKCNPGFIDSRNAIIAADSVLNNGANNILIWNTFAYRGLGYSASQGSEGSITDQTEAFNLPPGLGTYKNSDVPGLKIYPNPNKGSFTLKTIGDINIAKIELYDLPGRELSLNSTTTTNSTEILIEAENIPGLYLLKVRTDKGIFIQKILIHE